MRNVALLSLALGGCVLETEPVPALGALEEDAFLAALASAGSLDEDRGTEGPRFRLSHRESAPPENLPITVEGGWRIARSPAGDRVWFAWDENDAPWFEHSLEDAPSGALLFVYSDDTFAWRDQPELAVVVAPRGWLLVPDYTQPGVAFGEAIGLEVAGEIGTPPEEALGASIVLRRMKACPVSEAPCLLFGEPEFVRAALDPLYPPGGISMAPLPQEPPPDGDVAESTGADGRIAMRTVTAGDEGAVHTSFAFRFGGRDHAAFELPVLEAADAFSGVETLDDRYLVWAWVSWDVALGFSFHDRETGERIGDPVVLAGSFYYAESIDCGHVYTSTRPVPVVAGGRTYIALVTGADPMLLFDTDGSYVRDVEIGWEEPPISGEDEIVPPYFELRDDGRIY
jgi:hypothetical protein